MAEETKVTTEATVEETPKKPVKTSDPVKELKKENKELKEEIAKLETTAEQYRILIDKYKQEIDKRDNFISGLVKKYNKISAYIKNSTEVFATGILMALEENKED